MNFITLARNAMACRFEIVLAGEDPTRLRAAGEEALGEIDRIEAQLSLYRPSSEIARVNALAGRCPVRVSPEVFTLLKRVAELHEATSGAFDVTLAPLIRAWGFMEGIPRCPATDELEQLRKKVGMRHVIFDDADRSVQFACPGVMIDLGAIGKGYAIEQAANLLGEAGITSGLIHGGTSTVYAIGAPPGESCWTIAVENPVAAQAATNEGGGVSSMRRLQSAALDPDPASRPAKPCLFNIGLRDMALSVSSPSGKCFENDGQMFGHIIDPTTGRPARAGMLAAVALPSATETDALSTALLVLGEAGRQHLKKVRPAARTWFVNSEMRVFGEN